MIARVASAGALVAALVLIALVVLANGNSYTLRADFQDAGGLVSGNDVMIGPAKVGSVKSIGLTRSGQAEVVLGLDSGAAPMRQGTVARIYQNSLSGIANRYVVLEPASGNGPPIPSGGLIPESRTYSLVSLDQVFDALNPLTRAGLRGFIRGEATSIQGRALAANKTLQYFAPGLASTSAVTAELTRDEPAFDGLVVEGAEAMQALASRSQQLSDLIASANTTAAAVAGQSQALQQALVLFPSTLRRGTVTFAGLDRTLDALDPLVAKSKPAVRRLAPFTANLRKLATASLPTITSLSTLVHNPAGTADLTSLALQTPALAKQAAVTFPRLIQELNDSQPQLDYLREYTPDVVAALTNVGQSSAYYDANGHYVRSQPDFFAFGVNAANQLTAKPDFDRYQGVEVAHGRCPGGAVQPSPDGSAPQSVPGCQPSSTPPGP
jgi:phospholipid/cholesterol/gamma-HCH transport system substrate-binding protein